MSGAGEDDAPSELIGPRYEDQSEGDLALILGSINGTKLEYHRHSLFQSPFVAMMIS